MERQSLGFMQLTIVCGFCLFYAWYLISFFGVFISIPAEIGFVPRHIGQVLFFLGSVIAAAVLLLAFEKANSVAVGHKRPLCAVCLIPGSLIPLMTILDAMGIVLPLPAFYVLCLVSGTSIAVGFMLWEDVFGHGYIKKSALAHAVIFCAGGIIFLICIIFLLPLQLGVVSELFICASTALLAFIMPRCNNIEDRPIAPAREYFRNAWNIDIVVIVTSLAFGYAFILLYEMGSTTLLAVMGVAFCADLAFSLVTSGRKWVAFIGMVRICAALVSCAFLLYICPGEIAQRIALCIIAVFWFVFRTFNGAELVNLSMKRGYSVLYMSTRGKTAANVGFTAGLAIGVAAKAAGIPSLDFYIPVVITAAFILVALFLLPLDNSADTAGYKTVSLVESHIDGGAEQDGMAQLCERITRKFKLSPREGEVLVYVVRGRNAKHVSEKLFISESTAKTHIANIYRKLGVHSQQELLDKLDTLKS